MRADKRRARLLQRWMDAPAGTIEAYQAGVAYIDALNRQRRRDGVEPIRLSDTTYRRAGVRRKGEGQ